MASSISMFVYSDLTSKDIGMLAASCFAGIDSNQSISCCVLVI